MKIALYIEDGLEQTGCGVAEHALPQGLDAHDSDHLRSLRLAYEEWEEHQSDPSFHRAWVRFVLSVANGELSIDCEDWPS